MKLKDLLISEKGSAIRWKHHSLKGARMAVVEESEYKGNPMIVLKNTEDDKFPFQFGIKKAKLVLEHIEDIKKFVEKHDKPK